MLRRARAPLLASVLLASTFLPGGTAAADAAAPSGAPLGKAAPPAAPLSASSPASSSGITIPTSLAFALGLVLVANARGLPFV
jgi:hypothetical protein